MKTTPAPLTAAATLLLAFGLAPSSPAASVTLQQGLYGYAGTADAWLDETGASQEENNGGDPGLHIQYNSGLSDSTLIRFQLPTLSFQSVSAATLWLYLYDTYSMSSGNALEIKPYRIVPGKSWDENIYIGQDGFGVNWKRRDAANTLDWTGQNAGWNDKADDGNGTRKIKPDGGSVPDAIAPTNWVDWAVQPTVAQWHAGQENNGFGLYMNALEGPGYIAAGLFYSRNHSDVHRPALTVTYQGAAINWGGYASAAWDTTAANWNVGGYRGTYGEGDFVTFADGAGTPGVSVAGGGVTPGSVNITNTSTAYTFSGGSIGGSGTFTKSGSGTATLSSANGYVGLTLVKGGTLVVAANNALGTTGSGTVVSNGAALAFQGGVNYASTEPLTISGGGGGGGALYAVSGDNTFAGPVTLAADSTVGVASGFGLSLNGSISGAFSLTKTGQGILTLGGAGNTYSGATYVNQGTLALGAAGSIPNSPVIDVAAGGVLDVSAVAGGFKLAATAAQTLKGSGTVNGSVDAGELARLEPGESTGTLTFLNDLTLAPGVTNYFELTNSVAIGVGTNDLIVVLGDLALSDNVIAITVLGPDPLGAGTYRLFDYAGAKSGSFNPTPLFLSGAPGPGSTAWIDESVPNQVNLVVVTPISTVTLVSSAPNPSLPGGNITLTATVNPVPPGTDVPTGEVTFKTNSAPLGPAVPLVNGVASLETSGLPHGFTTVWAEYPGEGIFLGSTGSVVHLVNTPPLAGADVAYVMQNEKLVLPVAALLANDNDPDGDPLNILQVSALSTNGGTAALVNGTNVAYLPKPDYTGGDLITYKLGDPYTNVTVAVYIHVLSAEELANRIVAITNEGGGAVTLTVTGMPGREYWVQAVTNLSPPYFWQTLTTNIAGTNGLFEFTDLGATNPETYYRSATSTNAPVFRMYDAELLQLDIVGGGTHTSIMVRESPTLASPGMTRIELQITGLSIISSFFDVFTELSLNNGLTWSVATNGSVPLILVGGTPLNEFPAAILPPPSGRYISPPEWPELYPQGVIVKDITIHKFSLGFLPPAPGETVVYHLAASAELRVSFDGGQSFTAYTAPCQVAMRVTGRLEP